MRLKQIKKAHIRNKIIKTRVINLKILINIYFNDVTL